MTVILFRYYLKKTLKSPFTYLYLLGIPVYALIFNLFTKTNIVITNSITFQKNDFTNFQVVSINIISFLTAGFLIGLSTSILRDRYIKYEKKFKEEIARITTIIGIAIISTIPYLIIYVIILLVNNYGFDKSILLLFISILFMIIMLSVFMGFLANFFRRAALYTIGWILYLLSLLLPFLEKRILIHDPSSVYNGIVKTLIIILPPFKNLMKISENNNYSTLLNAVFYTLILIIILFIYTEGVNFARKKMHHGG
ncbi:hypothetical protein DRP44_01505 [candidate division TA06 bacterium]|jgi:hypothetical protein|uniref:Uncharacterized protein n=1 Tax=candidate division TA06 bacterium TaxID=2250710 RepID=A0A660SCQ4_UNCT6|nr:MAG: hypothetical protein DRP44_01505 [candidate division TA06 bacterium]